MNIADIQVDIAIVGGGIAGLWALNKLQAQGFRVALLEKHSLGGGQTICSQGIIHGGMKYALTGILTKDAQELAGVPELWRQCLQGGGVENSISKVDLSLGTTKILADAQHLFSTGSLATSISSFFASKALQSSVTALARDKYPATLQHQEFKGQVYKLAELVLDVPSLLHNLAQPVWQNIIKIEDCAACYSADNSVEYLQLKIGGGSYKLSAQQYVFLAGSGNQELIADNRTQTRIMRPRMQLRPLHMVYVKSPELTPLYAHCMALSPIPRITITTHFARDGAMVWYMGGNLAEEGVARDQEQQIAFAKRELAELLPWLTLYNAKWGSLRIDRAEAYQGDGKKPTAATLLSHANVHIGWPTKLAFSPLLARQIRDRLTVVAQENTDLTNFPKPEIAKYPWDTE